MTGPGRLPLLGRGAQGALPLCCSSSAGVPNRFTFLYHLSERSFGCPLLYGLAQQGGAGRNGSMSTCLTRSLVSTYLRLLGHSNIYVPTNDA